MYRTTATAVSPATDLAVEKTTTALEDRGLNGNWLQWITFKPGSPHQRIFYASWFVGLVIVGLVGMNLVIPRFFCRVLCPLGAFLGFLSRFAIWRIDRDRTRCTDCNLCLAHCEGASDPQAALRKSECFVCFNCIDDCPEDALSFSFMPAQHPAKAAEIGGRPVISSIPETESNGLRRAGQGWCLPPLPASLRIPRFASRLWSTRARSARRRSGRRIR